MKKLNVGLIGFGTVGGGVVKCILENGEQICERTGINLKLVRIADRDITTDRGIAIPKDCLTTNVDDVLNDENIDVVIELVGGTTFAKDVIIKALQNKKNVVTANKALISKFGQELFAIAAENNVDLYYEASVGGGIPIIKALREGLAANRISKIFGILNGTCNYILSRMENEKLDFSEVLREAQQAGYAEANPSLDIDGYDTGHKAAILASLAFGHWYGFDKVHIEGIRNVTLDDIQSADEHGFRIKLLAVLKQTDEFVELRVQPSLVHKDVLLGSVNGVFNAIWLEGDYIGQTMLYGKGAGREATASAVVSDVIDIGRNLKFNATERVPGFKVHAEPKPVRPMEEIQSRYYLRIQASDRLGLLAEITQIFSECGVSISSLSAKNPSRIIILTNKTTEAAVRKAAERFNEQPHLYSEPFILRIIDL